MSYSSTRQVGRLFFASLFLLLFAGLELSAQYYEFSLLQRRRFDQIDVEVWAKSLETGTPELGNSSLVLKYNTAFLAPAATQDLDATDSIAFNINQSNPIVTINSNYSQSVNGYNPLSSRSYGMGYYALELNLATLGQNGLAPSQTGKGSFLGKLTFDITGSPDQNSLTNIAWSDNVLPGEIQVFDKDSNSIKSNITFTNPGDYNVLGVTILSPNKYGQVVDRDADYAALSGDYSGGGYPIYFERSVNPTIYNAPIDEDLAYMFQYSLNNGSTWTEIGRVAETDQPSTTVGPDDSYTSGEIFSPNVGTAYTITTQNGEQIDAANYRDPLRVVWAKNPFFVERSEQARLRIIKLAGSNAAVITNRSQDVYNDINDDRYVLGRLFFLQLDGQSEYLVTEDNFSNSTQLTVETWINLNEYQATGSEPGIVVSSGGANAAPIFGSNEGAWMLYLKDGKIPAFRAREIEGRGDNGYIGTVQAYYLDSLMAASDAEPLDNTHANNWVHLAATVNNNTIRLYVNGELADQVVNNNATNIRMLTTNHPVWVGVNPNGGIEADDYLHAGIKSVRVWRIALSQEELRARVSGVLNPTDVSTYGDVRRGLQMYFNFEGEYVDQATDATYQGGSEDPDYYTQGVVDNFAMTYRPDQPHITLTSPVAGAGVSNRQGEEFEIRWVAYGLGDLTALGTNDVEIEYSLDGTNWYYAESPDGVTIGEVNAPDVEPGNATWEPYENENSAANLRTIDPYAKSIWLRARGTAANTQDNLMDLVGPFTVAPYFAIKKEEGAILLLEDNAGMNITGDEVFMEAWVRPYRFPTETEEIFPIITKADSTADVLHYSFDLRYDGRLQLKLSTENGTVRTAISDAAYALERPNSVSADSVWTHVAVYANLNGGSGQSEVIFYVDGIAQRADSITSQLGTDFTLNSLNSYPTYIGYSPYMNVTYDNQTVIDSKQTENIVLSGNINSGTPVGTERNFTGTIYDKDYVEQTFDFNLLKTDNAREFSIATLINGTQIPRATENVTLSGNINNAQAENDVYNTDVLVYDDSDAEFTLGFTFTKTANSDEFNLAINLGNNNVNLQQLSFASGSVSPSSITLSATDLNNAGGNFNTTVPKDVIIDLSGLTYSANANDAAAGTVSYRTLTFNADGSVNSPETLTFSATDLNTAAGSNLFTSDIRLWIAPASSSATGLTYLPTGNTYKFDSQDGGTGQSIVVNDTLNAAYFIGELRELRMWQGSPNNTDNTGNEPTAQSLFIQGAQAVRAGDLDPSNINNLNMSFSFNGGSFIQNGYNRAIDVSTTDSDILIRNFGQMVEYAATEPYVKVVEPAFNDRVANTKQDVRVRWVGFDYTPTGFSTGDAAPTAPALEFSIRGGGGKLIQPYQYVGSDYFSGNTTDAMSFPNTASYIFTGTGSNIYYATQLDASISDPDEDNNGVFSDQGPLSASLTNARLRLTGQYSINGETATIDDEGPLFTITPASNFTIRVLLEGYHNGSNSGNEIQELASSYEEGGLMIKLYSDNSGALGELVGTAESLEGYDDLDPANRNNGNNRFANVNFVFTDLTDGNYWVVVYHKNHMPIMSRYAVPFQYEGDDRTTWEIESGWDFQTWDGADNNALVNASGDSWDLGAFTAYGDVISTTSNPLFTTTGLIFNNGVGGGEDNAMSSMVAGDVDRSGQIDAADRIRVRLDEGTSIVGSDVTGDGFVNADDRTIVDRNHGHIASIYNVNFPDGDFKAPTVRKSPQSAKGPYDVEVAGYETLSKIFNKTAQNYKVVEKYTKGIQDKLLAGLNYKVSATPNIHDGVVDLEVFIENTGDDFALANATFAFEYNTDDMQYQSLIGTENVIFNNNPTIGYVEMSSAPDANVENPIEKVRTIEVDYITTSGLPGENVPDTKTYLGTLRFKLTNPVGRVIFKWHESTALHSVKGKVITPYGKFETIDPIILFHAELTAPNGGEQLSQDRDYNITWNSNGTSGAYLDFSYDGGVEWERINDEAINLSDKSYTWHTPVVHSRYCVIRMLDADTGEELDRSDELFSILPNHAQLIKPASGDPVYTGGSTSQIKWVARGFDKLRFELTTDGEATWTVVKDNVDGSLEVTSWKLPKVTTKLAKMKMYDAETNELLGESGFFKILDGSLTFITPRAKERLRIDMMTRIRWTSSSIDVFDLELSTDGGANWQTLVANQNAVQSYLNWIVPDSPTDNAILRAIYQGDPEMEYNRTDQFVILPKTDVVEIPTGSSLSNVYPNPASEDVNIELNLSNAVNVELRVLDISGKEVMNLGSKYLLKGENRTNISVSKLSSGRYFLEFKGDDFHVVKEFNVVK